MRYTKRMVALLALLLVVAACGDDQESSALPTFDGDEPPTAGACEEGTVEECNDTLFPGDEPQDGLPPSDGSSGMVVGGGLTIADALATNPTGVIAVQGFYVDSGSGPMLCEALAESFPPQCGGASIPMADTSPVDPDSIQTNQNTSWTDELVTVVGEIVDGVLVPTPTSL